MSIHNSRQIADVKILLKTGVDGAGIANIEKTGTSGNVDTYTITLTSGAKYTFTVTNGKGISSIEKTGTQGLVDTYTITFNDGTNATFTVTNGNGIERIEKTSTSGNVDTYTITFTNGTTTTFNVTNGEGSSASSLPYDNTHSGLVATNAQDAIDEIVDMIPDATTIEYTGSASATTTRHQRIGIGSTYTEINGTKYMEQIQTLSTSADVSFTFTNSAITSDSVIEPFASIYGIVPKSITASNGSCVVVIPKHDSAVSCKIRIYIR